MDNWQKKIQNNIFKLGDYVNSLNNENIIIGYGAPTKSSLLIKLLKIKNNRISLILEDNKFKVNRFLPNTGIKIVPTAKITQINPDIIIIFAWNFSKDILKKLKNYDIKNCKIIIPLPKFKIIKL